MTGYCVCVCELSHVRLIGTPWTVAHQASLFMKFSREEYWSLTSYALLQGNILNPGIKPRSPTLPADFLPSEPLLRISLKTKILALNVLAVAGYCSGPLGCQNKEIYVCIYTQLYVNISVSMTLYMILY